MEVERQDAAWYDVSGDLLDIAKTWAQECQQDEPLINAERDPYEGLEHEESEPRPNGPTMREE